MLLKTKWPFLFFSLIFCHAFAQKNLHGIKQNDSYKTEISQTVNSATFATSQIVRKNLKSEDFFIPKDWRLVSVIPSTSVSSRNSEYILFFQDSKSGVHSLGIQMDGAVTGSNLLHIPASE
jgi:hypothetical protein